MCVMLKEFQRCAVHLLGKTVDRRLTYPKIFLKRPKNKADIYSIRDWCDHRKLKIVALKELRALSLFQLFHADSDINWGN